MDDEFKLCWKNFQENIASGFQNLYDRGDLVDVTLACDGKLLQAHKIVLAICSPYFQEIFTSNPCRHPIIILKDVSFNIMLELLEFMYQGVVNVKHTELQSFMKIGQLLQIKGLATNSNSSPASSASEKSAGQPPSHGQAEESSPNNTHNNSHSNSHHNSSNSANSTANNNSNNITNNSSSSSSSNSKPDADHSEAKGQSTQSNSRTSSPGGASRASSEASHLYALNKRPAPSDFSNDSLSIYSGKQLRRSMKEHTGGQHEGSSDTADNGAILDNPLNTEEFFLPPIPHISLGEPRYDLGGHKREQDGHHGPGGGGSSGSVGSLSSSASSSTAVNTLRNPFGPAFNLDYNFYKPSGNNSGGPSGSSNNAGPGSGGISNNGSSGLGLGPGSGPEYPNELYMPNDYSKNFANHMDIPSILTSPLTSTVP
ncbi:broad-complex core protein isoforms 1/2/3/4/5 isoform X4 [Drosophila miranda]|uniref:broad-complex core protein isoforms 1/2/3/4/5 isoform X4 n=1 Tax=Drosophila miranda TaxID=7229 RepID=UPI0007E75E08|nr:broad-complex core protein isoforms 1/2/3/4/5 isoform X4 [Drosophila miranda]